MWREEGCASSLSTGASALVEDVGDASLVMALLQAIEGDEALHLGHDAHIFGSETSQIVTESVVGSPVIRSMSVFEQWALEQGMAYAEVKPRRRRSEAGPPPGQMSLFAAV